MTLVVFFDTNAFFRKDIATDSEIVEIARYLRSNNIVFCTNRVVVTELINHRERDVLYISRFYSAWRGVFIRQSNAVSQDFEIRGFSREDDVLKPIGEHGIKILDNHSDDIHLGLEALYKGLKPTKKQKDEVQKVIREINHDPFSPTHLQYNYQDNLIKDFFIWRSVLSLVKNSPDTEVVFITANYKDFCDGDDDKLHPELASQYDSDLHGNVVRIRNLSEFVERHINFVRGFDLSIGDILRNMEEEVNSKYLGDKYLILDRVEEVFIEEIYSLFRFRAKIKLVFLSYQEANDGGLDYQTQGEERIFIQAEVGRSASFDTPYVYIVKDINFVGKWTN